MSGKKDLLQVDWSTIPTPVDDGKTKHLIGMQMPSVSLRATDGKQIDLSEVKGYTVIFIYPRTGQPGKPSLVEDWDTIRGARGCTPQSCSFRDNFEYFLRHGIQVFGLSTQDTEYQKEVVERLKLPYPILLDEKFHLMNTLMLPTFQAGNTTLLKRMALIINNGIIKHVFYPVFPPDQNANQVIEWFSDNVFIAP